MKIIIWGLVLPQHVEVLSVNMVSDEFFANKMLGKINSNMGQFWFVIDTITFELFVVNCKRWIATRLCVYVG